MAAASCWDWGWGSAPATTPVSQTTQSKFPNSKFQSNQESDMCGGIKNQTLQLLRRRSGGRVWVTGGHRIEAKRTYVRANQGELGFFNPPSPQPVSCCRGRAKHRHCSTTTSLSYLLLHYIRSEPNLLLSLLAKMLRFSYLQRKYFFPFLIG